MDSIYLFGLVWVWFGLVYWFLFDYLVHIFDKEGVFGKRRARVLFNIGGNGGGATYYLDPW